MARGEVSALDARSRIAVNSPDLSTMRAAGFIRIRRAPDAIEGALRKVAGP